MCYPMEMCFNVFSDDFAGNPVLIPGPLRTAPCYHKGCFFFYDLFHMFLKPVCRSESNRTGHGTTDWFQVGKGVHQGCILSPCLTSMLGTS